MVRFEALSVVVSLTGTGTRSKVSHGPVLMRLLISGAAPAFSAVTSILLMSARKEMVPSALSVHRNVCASPADTAFASRDVAPVGSAVTKRLFARHFRATHPYHPRLVWSTN